MWDNYSTGTPPRMTKEKFGDAWRSVEPEVSDLQILEAWKYADKNKSKDLDWDEYRRIYLWGSGPPKNEENKLKWYWDLFANDKGMNLVMFKNGFMIENPDTPMEEISRIFMHLASGD